MYKSLEEVQQGNTLHLCDDFVCILYFFNLDMEDTLDDSTNDDLISMDSDFPKMFSMQLTIISSNEHSDSQSPLLELDVIPTIMDVVPLKSHHPSPSILDQHGGHTKILTQTPSIMVVFSVLVLFFSYIILLFFLFSFLFF